MAIKYELDRMIASQRMFHHYHAFSVAKEDKEGCNLMVRLMTEGLMNAV